MSYRRLAAMTALSFISMYILMYAMVNAFANVYSSINQVYMAALMTAPMVVIELLLMGSMYPNKRLNVALVAASTVLGIAAFVGIRYQTGVGDTQFLRSMIPHHAGAILMCQEAPIQDGEIKKLCRAIIQGQQSEIDQMRSMLDRIHK